MQYFWKVAKLYFLPTTIEHEHAYIILDIYQKIMPERSLEYHIQWKNENMDNKQFCDKSK